MAKLNIKELPKLFQDFDFLLITDKEGYIQYYKTVNSLGARIVENPIGMHILNLHQHLDMDTSTVMRALTNNEVIINEKQHLNIFKERTVTVLVTTLPLIYNNEIIGAIEIDRYFDKDFMGLDKDSIENNMIKNHLFFTIDDIIENSPKMKRVKKQILKVAQTNSPVMIYGETGTGKELVAKAIHNHSFRKSSPFLVQNCSTIPSTLGESILFGTTKGSFTGSQNKVGIFDIADGGTLVLDELNSMDINLQSKLLRVTENNCFRRVGGENLINVDVRLISTLNEEPEYLMESNRIRKDLFYRLGVVLIHIPPLRERKEDIPPLIDFFINEYNLKMNKNIVGVSKEVLDLFMNYNWPGNVREIKHIIESAFNFIEGDVIEVKDLPNHILKSNVNDKNIIDIKESDEFDLSEVMKKSEIKYINLALESSNTLKDAAKLLKISRQSLKYKMESYGIEINQK
ncbi:sigma 54-interacting transcriptional regulator [Tissierella sp.]|uniref:sigma-54 interaction domain-containing protein n=1 Tax=Tissierella sp. TaxID=41274 RepID=UPI0028660C11|nr:sigma 54-interacting transcriptional regulator [Tissierella sp.]MDR7855482.1 sigma 54-interacting transcriptional regulator [Tissierella sp.]